MRSTVQLKTDNCGQSIFLTDTACCVPTCLVANSVYIFRKNQPKSGIIHFIGHTIVCPYLHGYRILHLNLYDYQCLNVGTYHGTSERTNQNLGNTTRGCNAYNYVTTSCLLLSVILKTTRRAIEFTKPKTNKATSK